MFRAHFVLAVEESNDDASDPGIDERPKVVKDQVKLRMMVVAEDVGCQGASVSRMYRDSAGNFQFSFFVPVRPLQFRSMSKS